MFFRHETLAAEPRERDKRRAVRFSTRVVRKLVRALKGWFPYDRRRSRIADRKKFCDRLRSFAIVRSYGNGLYALPNHTGQKQSAPPIKTLTKFT